MNEDIKNHETDNVQNAQLEQYCLNCGTELKGKYCHICGQEIVTKKPTIIGVFKEYLNEIFFWDYRFFKTFWTLISRPGHLTNEYLAGKYISYTSPLKLNMFLLFVFITLFVFFASAEKMTSSVHNLTKDERVFPAVQLNLLMDNPKYAEKIKESPRDTVKMYATLLLTENFPEIIGHLEIEENTNGEGLDKWVAIIPRVLIEENFVVLNSDGYYSFNTDKSYGQNELNLFNLLCAQIVSIASRYFPMILLLTAPFLSISLSLVQRKSKRPHINHFIFSLHYTALLETLIILVYALYLTIAPPMRVLEGVITIGSCVYLTIAFRRVYAVNSWGKAIVKSLLTSITYLCILFLIFIVIFFIACFIIANDKNLIL